MLNENESYLLEHGAAARRVPATQLNSRQLMFVAGLHTHM